MPHRGIIAMSGPGSHADSIATAPGTPFAQRLRLPHPLELPAIPGMRHWPLDAARPSALRLALHR